MNQANQNWELQSPCTTQIKFGIYCKYHPDRPPTLSYQYNLVILPAYLLQKTSRLIRRGVYIRIYRWGSICQQFLTQDVFILFLSCIEIRPHRQSTPKKTHTSLHIHNRISSPSCRVYYYWRPQIIITHHSHKIWNLWDTIWGILHFQALHRSSHKRGKESWYMTRVM